MRQNSIQNRLQMISMEEYLEKRQKIRETERKRDKKTVCSHQKLLRDNAVYKSKDECADVKKNQQDCSDQCHDTF